MTQILGAVILLACALQLTHGYCCFRDAMTLTPKCGCLDFDIPCGVVKCQKSCSNTGTKACANTGTKACGCSKSTCSNAGSNTCGCSQPAYIIGSSSCDCASTAYITSSSPFVPSACDCGIPACSCYKDTSNVCFVRDQPSPMCSCLKAANGVSDCGCDNKRSYIYFPEVEYPVTIIDMKPFYSGGCYLSC